MFFNEFNHMFKILKPFLKANSCSIYLTACSKLLALTLILFKVIFVLFEFYFSSSGGGGGGASIYGLYRYVPRDRVWFLRFSILKRSINFAHVGIGFPV